MKFKTTKKAIQAGYYRIASIGYCNAQSLLKYRSPVAYSAGVYGWNGDYYEVDGVLIATGYRGLPDNKNVKCDYEIVRRFETAATGKGKEETEKLLEEFIENITKEVEA